MLGPYHAREDGAIAYRGNKVCSPIDDIRKISCPIEEFERRVQQFHTDAMWQSIARINHRINRSANNYFDELGALFTTLPLITRMISSPGAVYGKEAISYTSDTSPITVKWFKQSKPAFLSESSQIYLELALMQEKVHQVYSIYNSFRKEEADATHLSEFHHIEYEGKVNQAENNQIALGLVSRIIKDLFNFNEEDLTFFLQPERRRELHNLSDTIQSIPAITFREALNALERETKQDKYKRFTMNHNFGEWEEIKLTEMYGNLIAISQFPLLEVPFYHAMVDGVEHTWDDEEMMPGIPIMHHSGFQGLAKPLLLPVKKKSSVAQNTDFIWPGYREIIGSGHRVRSTVELEEKAKIFNLPREDYEPYLQTRRLPGYKETSGFGLGWERLVQGLLEMPFIWSAAQFPRVDKTLKP